MVWHDDSDKFVVDSRCRADRSGAYAPGTTTVLYVPQSAPQAESRYVVKRVPDGTIQVDWIRIGTVGGLDWLDVQARQRANRCGGIS